MKLWQKMLIPTLISLLIGGAYLGFVWHQRHEPRVGPSHAAAPAMAKDDLVVMRAFFPVHYEDTLRLEGTTVWMKNGYTMPYYAYTGGRINFGRRVGLIPAAEKLAIKKIVKAAVPAGLHDQMEHGSRQAFAVFALGNGKELYATPIGTISGAEESYFCDLLFYYDDPHTIYAHWPAEVWKAIDAHRLEQGMSELEAQMAVGQKMVTDGPREGERTVHFDQDGRKWAVSFVHNRATAIKGE